MMAERYGPITIAGRCWVCRQPLDAHSFDMGKGVLGKSDLRFFHCPSPQPPPPVVGDEA